MPERRWWRRKLLILCIILRMVYRCATIQRAQKLWIPTFLLNLPPPPHPSEAFWECVRLGFVRHVICQLSASSKLTSIGPASRGREEGEYDFILEIRSESLRTFAICIITWLIESCKLNGSELIRTLVITRQKSLILNSNGRMECGDGNGLMNSPRGTHLKFPFAEFRSRSDPGQDRSNSWIITFECVWSSTFRQ